MPQAALRVHTARGLDVARDRLPGRRQGRCDLGFVSSPPFSTNIGFLAGLSSFAALGVWLVGGFEDARFRICDQVQVTPGRRKFCLMLTDLDL